MRNEKAPDGQTSRAKERKTRRGQAVAFFKSDFTAGRAARQEITQLGAQAEKIAQRCTAPKQRARFESLARFLLRAALGRRG